VLFTSTAAGSVTVDLKRPDGTPVRSALAAKDSSARPSGAWQGMARLDGLEPSTLYCYSLRGLTRPAGFVTAPAPGSGAPVRFVVFGDSGDGGPGQRAVLEQLTRVPFDFIAHTGDLAYTHGRLHEIENYVFGVYAPLLRSHALFPASGNHDYRSEQAAPFREVFALPENGGPAGRERYYSFDWGDVHVAVIDTELVGPTQAAWLDADLAASGARWKVVYGHKPPFSSGSHGSARNVRDVFVPIFERHQVPLVLSGHEHNYERTRPLRGVTYIVTGGGGRYARSVGRSEFTAHSASVLHFVYIDATPSELVLHAIDATGREFDAVSIAPRT
jgi:3',5'-cyclic AMP phosphodiesterase CpdA